MGVRRSTCARLGSCRISVLFSPPPALSLSRYVSTFSLQLRTPPAMNRSASAATTAEAKSHTAAGSRCTTATITTTDNDNNVRADCLRCAGSAGVAVLCPYPSRLQPPSSKSHLAALKCMFIPNANTRTVYEVTAGTRYAIALGTRRR